MDIEQTTFKLERLDDGIPQDHYSRFIARFVDEFFPVLGIEENLKKTGNSDLPVREMFKLIIYAYSEGITSLKVIEDYARYHKIYIYLSNNTQPSQRSIRRFITEKGYLFNIFLGNSLLFANELGIKDLEYISIYGTIKKEYNSKFNVLHEKEIDTLIKHYSGLKLYPKKIKKLPLPAREFIEREDLNDEDKLDLLDELKTEIRMSGQSTIPVNDVEARWMYHKQESPEVAYDVQSTVSKLICAIKVSQNLTNHNELPEIVKKIIDNIGDKADYISADTGYHTETSFEYLEKTDITGLIPDRKQTRENSGRLSKNPFHKDHFQYDAENDVYICPNNQKLAFKYLVSHCKDDEIEPYKFERRYWNYTACNECKDKDKCYSGSSRQISEFVSPYALKMKNEMDTAEYWEMFKKRSSIVEAPFGTLKTYYCMDEMPITGIKHTEHVLSLFALTYNLKIINNNLKKIYSEIDTINSFIEKIGVILNMECRIR